MPKTSSRPHSRYTLEALALLGRLIRESRIQKRMSTQELAERAGISRDLLRRAEKGDPRCQIGVVFELAAILGIPLFAPELADIRHHSKHVEARLSLLPKAVHTPSTEVKDDF